MTGSVLATYPSSSSSAVHEVRLGKDGVTYCTCMGWRMNKHCKHLDNYQSNSPSTSTPTPLKHVKAGSMQKPAAPVHISVVTDEVIRILKGGK